MTQDHPSFAAVRFLLLKKMQDTAHPGFASQLHKTSVYFNNPLWLQLLLSPMKEERLAWRPGNGSVTEMIEHDKEVAGFETEMPGLAEQPVEEEPVAEEPVIKEDASLTIKLVDEPLMQEVLDRLRGQINEAGDLPPVDTTAQLNDPMVDEVLSRLKGQIRDADAQDYAQPPAPAETNEVGAGPSAPPTLHSGLPATDANIPAEIAAQEDEPADEDFAPIPDTAADPARDRISKIIIETPMAQSDVLFEPYHTIDYFASQGIRLDKLEPIPQDKLGRQLRSFTEWLKSMKKLPQASIERVLGQNEESAVVAAASHSVEGKVVITEAMAEVFEKQGMRDKAIEVYHKLSLLNPAKSAYFADRINALKHS